MDGKRREEREQAKYKPKEEKAHGYEPRQQSRTYREFVNFRKANEQAEKKRKEQAESKQKDEKARESERRQRAQEHEPGLPLDLYAILDVPSSVTQAELVKAARKKRIETHPDKFSGRNISPAEVDAIIETSKTVGHAADILCDPAARAKYDGETATWKKQRAASRGVPEGMSYFGSNSQASEDQPKHQSSGFNAYTEPRKAATSQKRDSTKSSYRDPNKFYDSSFSNDDVSDDSSSQSTHRSRDRKHSSAHSRPIPRPPRQAPRKSFGAADEPRFADAAYSRPAGRSAGFSRPQPFDPQPFGRSQRNQEPSPSARYARSRDNWQNAKQARFSDFRDFLDNVVEEMDKIDLDLPKPVRARFADGRIFDRFESASASPRGSPQYKDEQEIREGYRANNSRTFTPDQDMVDDPPDTNSIQFPIFDGDL